MIYLKVEICTKGLKPTKNRRITVSDKNLNVNNWNLNLEGLNKGEGYGKINLDGIIYGQIFINV